MKRWCIAVVGASLLAPGGFGAALGAQPAATDAPIFECVTELWISPWTGSPEQITGPTRFQFDTASGLLRYMFSLEPLAKGYRYLAPTQWKIVERGSARGEDWVAVWDYGNSPERLARQQSDATNFHLKIRPWTADGIPGSAKELNRFYMVDLGHLNIGRCEPR